MIRAMRPADERVRSTARACQPSSAPRFWQQRRRHVDGAERVPQIVADDAEDVVDGARRREADLLAGAPRLLERGVALRDQPLALARGLGPRRRRARQQRRALLGERGHQPPQRALLHLEREQSPERAGDPVGAPRRLLRPVTGHVFGHAGIVGADRAPPEPPAAARDDAGRRERGPGGAVR